MKKMAKIKTASPLENAVLAGSFYSFICFIPFLLSYIVIGLLGVAVGTEGDLYLHLSNVCNALCYLLGAVCFCRYFKIGKDDCHIRCKGVNPLYYSIAVLLALGLLGAFSWVNDAFLRFLGRFGYTSPEMSIPSLQGAGLLVSIISLALVPAVCEEFVFRGVLLGGLKFGGKLFAVLCCGVLFSLFHKNPAQTVYQFLCGAAFSLLALSAGSVLPAIVAHFVHNAAILVLSAQSVQTFTQPHIIAISLALVALCVGALILVEYAKKEAKSEGFDRVKCILALTPGAVLCILLWIVTFAAYCA